MNDYYYPSNSYYPQMQQRAYPQQHQQQSGVLWVQGEEAAKAYMVAAGNSVLLMDSEKHSFYIKSTDPSGMPMPLRIFDYTERSMQPVRKPEEYVTREEFDKLVARLSELTEGKKDEQ